MQNLTTTERAKLLTLRVTFLSARDFTASAKASDRLDTYISQLLEKGRSVEQILSITTA